ncbi:MAG TPA: hypothetical protein VMF56_05685 [Acidobacteriaceae bacterium]|nr:hypothetical protein [Acidobacteriaceae bacterium]
MANPSLPTAQLSKLTTRLDKLDERVSSLDRLEERVSNHIRFFWAIAAAGFVCMGALAALVYNTRSNVSQVAKAQIGAPAQIATALLRSPNKTPEQAATSLAAVNAVLKTAPSEKHRLSPSALTPVSDRLASLARTYPELPQVWQTTGTFIQYKSEVIVPDAAHISQVAQNQTCSMKVRTTILFSNCQISLEEVARNYQNLAINGHPATYQFVNCIVIYNGGELPGGPIIFQDCLFRFDVQKVPSPHGQSIMMLLASSPGADITIPSTPATHS